MASEPTRTTAEGKTTRVTRSISLHVLVLAALCAPAVACNPSTGAQEPTQEPTPTRPNVIVIVTDDQRADTLRELSQIRRSFKRKGVTYRNGFATTPLCCPSRVSILTGRYAHNHGVRTGRERKAAVAAQELMITKELQESGYSTGFYGKYINYWNLRKPPAYLDDWAIFANSAPNGYRHGPWNVNGTYRYVARYSTSYIRRKAIGFIERQEEDDARPWFAYLAPAAAHFPYETQRRYRRTKFGQWHGNPAVFEDDRSDKPPWVQSQDRRPKDVRQTLTSQLRTLLSVDDMVAEVFATLRRLGETRDTLAIFISDNGVMRGEHRLGAKRYPYLPAVRVPFLIRWPRMLEPGTVDDRLVANIDIAPTIADVAGVSLTEPDGRSLLSTEARDRLLLEFFRVKTEVPPPTWASTITADYQYIEYYDASGTVEYREYYDLIEDRWQLENLYGDADPTNDPPSGPQMSLQLQRDRSCAGDACP